MERKRVKIWYQTYDEQGNVTGTGVYHKDYLNYGTALNIARKQFGYVDNLRYAVGILNPFEEHSKETMCDICGKPHMILVDYASGQGFEENHFYMSSTAIDPEDGRKRFHKGYNTCPDCIVKIKNFVDSLREGQVCENS